jgi:hypothetical protein
MIDQYAHLFWEPENITKDEASDALFMDFVPII